MYDVVRVGRTLRKGTFLGLTAVAAAFFAGSVLAGTPFNSTPTKVIGPGVINQTPAPLGGWTAADNRIVGAPLIGQVGWTGGAPGCNSQNYDEEISHAAAHSGNQSLRVSNWYGAGCVDSIISPAFTPVGETGSVTAGNASPASKTVNYDFWFRSVSTVADPQNDIVTGLSGLASYRQTYLEALEEAPGSANCQNAAGCFHFKAVDIGSGGVFNHYYSPDLVRGAWYHVVISATFVDGPLNDQVQTQVFDANGTSVWNRTTGSWEYAYAAQMFGSSPIKLAVDHVTFDLASAAISTVGTYSTSPRPQGIYVDDMKVTPGSGGGFSANFDGNRYVNASGGSDTTDCSDSSAPCLTIAYAIAQSQPYNVIHVASGTYAPSSALSVTLEGLQIVGADPAHKPLITRQSGGKNQQLLVINGAKNVRVENLDFGIDQTFVAEGILASGFVDGLTIVSNHFGASQSSTAISGFGFRNAISINDIRNSAGLLRGDGSAVLIDGNVIDGVKAAQMRSGIDMDAGVGTISNNTVTAGTHDIIARFSTVVAASSATSLTIDHNTLKGRGLEFDAPNGGVSAVTISNNTINAIAGISGSTNYAADWSLVRLIDNQQNIPTTLGGNTFQGHNGSYRGVLIENYPGVQLTGNTFTPASGATDFVSLVVSNKEINSVSPAIAPYPMAVTALGNTFNGSGVANAGRAVEFLNDNDKNASATFGALIFGGTGSSDPNTFDGNLRWYFHLDDYNCNTVSSPTCTFLDYNGAIGNAVATDTQVRPFTGNVSAAKNTFAGVAPGAMTQAQQSALFARTYDKTANVALGTVDYGLTAIEPMVFVGASFAGANYGDPKNFVSGAPACGNQTVYFGVNAFATIPDGLMHVQSGGTVCVAKGNYSAAVTISNAVQLIGDGNGASDTVITAPVTVSASGTSAASPLLLQNLRVSNAGGTGVAAGAASYLSFDSVAFAGNGGSGLDFGNISNGVSINSSLFDGNVGAGLRTSTTAQVSNVAISGSTFSNNAAGIILFGASGSGNGQITNWTISGSQFLSNDNANATSFGGGIWLKTGGAGSVIDGFTVTGSTFADNGSSATLNRVGITVRARAGTTLRNVNICANSFAETPTPGTQLTGINVFDLTGNIGYQPITVCSSNTFTGLGHSLSGLEQHTANGSQPVVNITGGTIANTEYINAPVTRVRDSVLFPTITQAMNDAGTITGDTVLLGAGAYSENVTVTHDNMTLTGGGTTASVINGGNTAAAGITLPNGRVGTTISNLAVQNVHNSCIYGAAGNNNTAVTGTLLSGCRADLGSANGGGMYMNGPVDSVTFSDNEVTASAQRGFVIWNGVKTHITITNNNVHDLVGCCGIELQDGTASGVTVTGNTVKNTGDSGMAFIQLSAGAGANLIDNNTITNTGRFGIEIKNPNGSGAASGDGSIVISGNTVTRPATPTSTDLRDVGGIVVIRRGFAAGLGESDITTGAIVTGNTVTGWVPLSNSTNDGFGIVVEGTNMRVSGNTVSGNDVGVQLQAGNAGYPGDSDQAATNAFFARGDAPATCALLGSNTYSGNTTDSRIQTNPAGMSIQTLVHNTTRGTNFCTIQSAIDDAATVAGDTIAVDAGNFAENVSITKQLIVQGPQHGVAGSDPSRTGSNEAVLDPATPTANNAAVVKVLADNVTFDGFTISNVNNTAIASGGNYGGASSNAAILNNRILDVHAGSGLYTNGPYPAATGWTISRNLVRNVESSVGSGINYWAAAGGVVSDNTVEQSAFGGIQAVNSNNVQITGNTISDTAHSGINIGTIGASADGNVISGNTLSNANTSGNTSEGGLTLSGGVSNVTFTCNAVSGSGTNGFATATAAAATPGAHVFDNALTVASDISHNQSATLAIGSNWYGGSAPTVNGSNAAGAQVATALPATPIGSPFCGDNTTIGSVLAVSGTPQTTVAGTPFASPLKARVVDPLGGSIAGVAIGFAGPNSGASASMSPTSGTSDFDGVVSVAATANALTGSYIAKAAAGSETADFALTNSGQPSVALTLNGPSSAVAGTPTPGYTAQLSNTGSALSENVLVHFVLSRSGGFAAGDAVIEYDTGSGYAPIPLSPCGSNLCGSFGPPAGFALGAGYNSTTQLRFTSNRSGAVTLAATVEGVTSHTAYAKSSITVAVSASAQNIAANGQTTFNGTAGAALAAPLPSVIVTDAFGNPVSGVVVTFTAAANSGTLSGAMQTTDANGIATLGGWILDATPGTNTLTATAAGVIGSVTFTAEGAAATGALQVTITDNRDYVQFDHSLTIVATIGNNGDSNMSAVTVSYVLPPELDASSQGWQCMSFNGATCTPVTSGVPVTISLPAHSSVVYLLNATVNRNGSDLITNTISATGPDGAITATDTTEIVIFRDGFEQGGDGAQAVDPALDGANAATLDTTGQVALDVTSSALASLRVTTIARAADGTFRVEAIRVGSAVWLRLVAHGASADTFSTWSELGNGGAMLALGNGGTALILVGTAKDLGVTLAKAGPFALSHAAH